MATKKVTRFCAWESNTIPSTEPISSAWYSPLPASETARSRVEMRTQKPAVRIAISEIEIARSSSRSAPVTRLLFSPHCQISSPAVVAKVSSVSAGAPRFSGLKTAERRTTQRPTVRAMIGEMPA